MASDDLVWNIIGTDFCSFKVKTTKGQTFCRETHNVTGFCSRQACPLANSRYASILAHPDGTLYLYMKDVERSHLPSKWWSRIKLSPHYQRALEQVDEHLKYHPKFLSHKNKQRLTRLTQIGIRMKKLAKEEERLGERIVPRLAPKVRRREEARENKALSAAKVERAIERVLIDRLRSGAYGDRPLNVEPGIWEKVLAGLEREGHASMDKDLDEGIGDDEEQEDEVEYETEPSGPLGEVEYVADVDSEFEDLKDLDDWLGDSSGDEEDSASGSEDVADEDLSNSDTGEEDRDDSEARKLALKNLKRKRSAGPPTQKAKKIPKKGDKGPRVEIEYEVERSLPTGESLYT